MPINYYFYYLEAILVFPISLLSSNGIWSVVNFSAVMHSNEIFVLWISKWKLWPYLCQIRLCLENWNGIFVSWHRRDGYFAYLRIVYLVFLICYFHFFCITGCWNRLVERFCRWSWSWMHFVRFHLGIKIEMSFSDNIFVCFILRMILKNILEQE